MEFPNFISGPQFSEGNFVSFKFRDAELTLRLPVLPNNDDTIDKICVERDFSSGNTSSWNDCLANRIKELVVQNWNYMDDVTHDDVANCFMEIHVLEHRDIEDGDLRFLNGESYTKYFLQLFKEHHEPLDPETRPGWPSIENDFLVQRVAKPEIDGFQILLNLSYGTATHPTPVAFFSLGKNLSLKITFEFGSLHYSGRKNPYSNEMLHKFKAELFDEFLSFVNIEYSQDILALIAARSEG